VTIITTWMDWKRF